MPASKKDKEFVAYVVDMMRSIGPVYAKGMFGGHGVFLNKLMFALIFDQTLYFKADKDTRNAFIDLGLEPFVFVAKGKRTAMSYYQSPEETMENLDDMNEWANIAYGAALRAAAKKTKG